MLISHLPLEDVTLHRLPAAWHAYELRASVAAPPGDEAAFSVRYEVRGRSLHVWSSFRYATSASGTVPAFSVPLKKQVVRFLVPEVGRNVQGVELENIYVHDVGELGTALPVAALPWL